MPGLGTVMPQVTNADPAADDLGVVVRTPGGFAPVTSAATAVVTRVPVGSGAAVTVLADNPDRIGFEIQSEFANGQLTYVKDGTAASATDATAELQPGGSRSPVVNYTGPVTAIAASGTQNLKVTEY